MDSTSHVVAAVVPIVVAGVLGFLLRNVPQRAIATADGLLVRYGLAFRLIGGLAAAITLAAGVGYFLVAADDQIAMLVLVVLFGGLAVPIVLAAFGVRIELRQDTIVARAPWRHTRQIPLRDIESIGFSAPMQWHLLHTRSHGVVRMSVYLSGVREFLDTVRQRAGLESSRR